MNFELERRCQEDRVSRRESQKEQQFVKCVVDMVASCHPPSLEAMSLKSVWRWLKSVLDDYMQLRKSHERSKSL